MHFTDIQPIKNLIPVKYKDATDGLIPFALRTPHFAYRMPAVFT